MAIRLDAKLKQLDPLPFEIAILPPQSYSMLFFAEGGIEPFLVPTPQGVIIVYSRFENGSPRIVTRTLDRLRDPHRRAVTH